MKSGRRLIIFTLFMVFSLFLTACQQEKSKTIIGVINPAPIMDPVFEGFKAGMKELGYIEGENVEYIYEGPVGKDGLEGAAQNLLKQNVNLILSLTTPATQVMKEATTGKDVPVVFVPVTDPVGAGIVSSLQEPGGNITGITTGAAEGRRFEQLLRIVPAAKRVYLPYNSEDASPVGAIKKVQEVADKLDAELVLQEVTSEDEVKAAIADIPNDVDAIFIGPDSLVGSLFKEWVAAAIEHKLPLTGSSSSHVEAGMLMSYSYDTFEAGKQAARLADRILKGAKPAELPVESTEFFLSLNLKTAEAIELSIPDEILREAKTTIRE